MAVWAGAEAGKLNLNGNSISMMALYRSGHVLLPQTSGPAQHAWDASALEFSCDGLPVVALTTPFPRVCRPKAVAAKYLYIHTSLQALASSSQPACCYSSRSKTLP